jgi:hypothetical protein
MLQRAGSVERRIRRLRSGPGVFRATDPVQRLPGQPLSEDPPPRYATLSMLG